MRNGDQRIVVVDNKTLEEFLNERYEYARDGLNKALDEDNDRHYYHFQGRFNEITWIIDNLQFEETS